ncbi:hypothetical protein [Nocardioides terrisoli]|uniref:hypothetical protein n=1 Tax=Nocardioides terrisoli TaxID=3388267 RepID=UPI00287B838E|nr:hypothetical protein [Nocardioides marmorisolisilvae]
MRRTRTMPAGVAAFGALTVALFCPPAVAAPSSTMARAADFGGFATTASGTPLRLELFEPAIPIPASPQAELNLSYTKVAASSGPTGTARASALWPGDPVGEGLKTIVDQAGLPPQLGAQGYPVQVNAQSPGGPQSQKQEVLPGQVDRVRAGETSSVARSGYSASGNLAGDQQAGSAGSGDGSGDGSGAGGLLDALKSGDLGAIGGALTGTQQGTDGAEPTSSPLGALSLLVDPSGMSSVSRTDYGTSTVSAQSTTAIGRLDLLGGIVQLSGISSQVVATSDATVAKTVHKVDYGRLSIMGTSFALTSGGIEASGKTTAIPGLSDNPTKALAQLGISIDLPQPTHSAKGTVASVSARGPVITIDTEPLKSRLPALPLDKVANSLPDSAGQLKSLLLAASQAHPKIVLVLGQASADAQTVKAIGAPPIGSTGTPSSPPASSSSTPAPTAPVASGGGASGGTPGTGAGSPTAAGPVSTTAIAPTSATPGLPPLGSVPGMLTLGGLALAALTGWWLRRALAILFGGSGPCAHGLQSGLPDLRKV